MLAAPYLQVDHLQKYVQSVDTRIDILRDINLTIKTGESVAILGASGSGKTTLLTLLAGLDVPSSGDIILANEYLNKLSEEERALIRAKKVGFVFQSFRLLSSLTALENVMLPLELTYTPRKIAYSEAMQWLQAVGLENRITHYPTKLSGGEQQRVAIARAFVNRPEIIFADEMTGNLDTQTGKKISDLLFSLNEQIQTTLVLVTHDATLAQRCQRRYLLNEGVLTAC